MTVETWLLDSDPAIRWQAKRDILGLPEPEWATERARIVTHGWGAQILSHQDDDGQWAGGAYFPAGYRGGEDGQPWTATTHTLSVLRGFGIDADSEAATRTVRLIGENGRWDQGSPYWEGEDEPCVNGATVANGSYFGVDTSAIVDRLIGEALADGGWNCEAVNGSLRSSFDSTINVLEGLLAFEQATGGTVESKEARKSAEEYLLKRELFKRLSTGEPADDDYLLLRNPVRWQYDILRALDYFRSAGLVENTGPDPRLAEATELVRSRRQKDGTWLLDKNPSGSVWFDIDDGEGQPSRWITLRALRALAWSDA